MGQIKPLLTMLIVLSIQTTSFGFIDALYGTVKDQTDNIQTIQQFAELIKIQKNVDIKLQKLNEFSETIAKHTGIKITSTDEAYRLLVDKNYQKRKSLDGLLSNPYFKNNPELSDALKKVAYGQELTTMDISGIAEIIVLKKDSEALIIRRLQRKGYSAEQIDQVIAIVRQVHENQSAILAAQTNIAQTELRIEQNKQLKAEARKRFKSTNDDKTKNKNRERELTLEGLVLADTQILLDQKKLINPLITKQNLLINRLSYYEIAFDYEIAERLQIREENKRLYLSQLNKANAAENRLKEFVEFSNYNIGRY